MRWSKSSANEEAGVQLGSRLITRSWALTVFAGVGLIVLLAGCTSSSSDAAAKSTPVPGTAADSIGVGTTSLGSVMVDAQGRTLYMLTSDSRNQSNCSAACLTYWPPVPAPASGQPSSPQISAKVGETNTTTGLKMLTVGGWPVYTYVSDQAAGDVTGEGIATFGGTWYAISPSGTPVKAPASTGTSTSPSPGTSQSSSGYTRSY
ncbi:MAG TPA: hypothetical protein VMT27_00175 [Actinomycetes bacterium]|nr:hypothetical protein [Actinomycetes bacterium]